MSDYKDAIEALNTAEQSLLEQLDKVRAAKAALGGGDSFPSASRSKRHRRTCILQSCGKGFLAAHKDRQYCSKKCRNVAYELVQQRLPAYKPGGSQYEKHKNKPAILLKGDAVHTGN